MKSVITKQKKVSYLAFSILLFVVIAGAVIYGGLKYFGISADTIFDPNKVSTKATLNYSSSSGTYSEESDAVSVKISTTNTPTPSVTVTQEDGHPFPKGFSVFGNTKTISKETFSVAGLYLYKFDGANNKWLLHPGPDSFDVTAFYGYYVYNKQDTKTLSIPGAPTVVNLYKVTPGWNMFWSVNEKPLSQLQFQIDNQAKTASEWIASGKLDKNIFIIDNDRATESCNYFKLLGTVDTAANCSNNSLGTTSKIPAGKGFWVYVK